MSDSARLEHAALAEVTQLVTELGEQVVSLRARALRAEARLRDLESGAPVSSDRAAALQRENAALRKRLEQAAERTRTTLDRLRFLRQQGERGAER